MELFLKAFFWYGLVGCFLKLALISIRKYPHETSETLGGDLVKLIEVAVFVVWAGVLVWGGR